MIRKKDDKLLDLECMIPSEHKREAIIEEPQTVIAATPTQITEACCECSRSSEDTVLMPVFHQGEDKWMCPRCLKSRIDSDSPSLYGGYRTESYQQSSEPSYSESSYTESTESSESTDPDYSGSNPMSMFD